MITLNNGISGISSILGALTGTQETNDTETATSLKTQYKTAAQDLVSEYGSGNELDAKALKSSSLLNGFSVANKNKLTKHLGTLSLSEIADLLRRADGNRNGEVTATERRQYLQTLIGYIEDGKSAGEIQALNNARFLKNGGTVSDATKEKWLAQFEEYNIAKSAYTPDEKTATTADTDWSALLEKFGPSLIGAFQNNGSSSSSSVPSLPLPSLASMSGGLPGMPPLGMPSMETLAGFPLGFTGLDGKPFNPLLPSQGLGTNPFGGASTLNPLLAGSAGLPTAFNPLTAGSAQQPFGSPYFVPPVGVAATVAPSGFIVTPPVTSPVATVGTAPALPTPVVATTPAVNPAVPAVDPWAPATRTPTLLAQVPAQPTANGGW